MAALRPPTAGLVHVLAICASGRSGINQMPCGTWEGLLVATGVVGKPVPPLVEGSRSMGWEEDFDYRSRTNLITNIAQFIQDDDSQNEIRMLDVVGETNASMTSNIWTFTEMKSDAFKICLEKSTTNVCVTSFPGYSGLGTECDVEEDRCETSYLGFTNVPLPIPFPKTIDRVRIAELLRKQFQRTILPSERATLLEILSDAHFNSRQVSNLLTGVDVSFKQSSFLSMYD